MIFAERGLWNRFVPSLDGYIQDRLNNPIHLPNHGTLKTLRLEAPALDLVRRIVEARLRPALEKLPDFADLPPIFPFTEEQIDRVARTEPTLRDMLQQFRHQFDHVVYRPARRQGDKETRRQGDRRERPSKSTDGNRTAARGQIGRRGASVDSSDGASASTDESSVALPASLSSMWDQELRAARRKLEPEGALTGATRELQAGLGAFLQLGHEHGVKVGPWRLHHVVGEWTFGDHPTYGVMTIAHWVCKDGQPWKVGIGLFLGRGPAKPRDLGTKLSALDVEPSVDRSPDPAAAGR